MTFVKMLLYFQQLHWSKYTSYTYPNDYAILHIKDLVVTTAYTNSNWMRNELNFEHYTIFESLIFQREFVLNGNLAGSECPIQSAILWKMTSQNYCDNLFEKGSITTVSFSHMGINLLTWDALLIWGILFKVAIS